MYLQLSENGNANSRQGNVKDNANPYVFVPDITGNSRGFYVREDNFDDLDDKDWNALMVQIAPYQPQVQNGGMSEDYFLSNRASRKAKREQKTKDKQEKRQAKNAIKKAKAVSIERGDRKDMLNNLVGGLTNIFGKKDSTATAPGDSTNVDTTDTTNIDRTKAPEPGAPPESFWDKYKTPILIGGTVLTIAGIAYSVHNKRKRAPAHRP